jgi:cytochrome c biogenesis protein CcmG, thiol:disulfide interchange protein DsbE
MTTKGPKKLSKSGLVWSGVALALFLSLMIYAMTHDPNALPSQLVGKAFPDFQSSFAQGGDIQLSQVRGTEKRWTVINFWNTTCVVCREEAPELERMYQTSLQPSATTPDGHAFPKFLSVNIQDPQDAILRYVESFRLSYPIVLDKLGRISLDYGVTGTPETFFIDTDGLVRHRVAGAIDLNSMVAFIDWLEKNPSTDATQAMAGFLKIRSM